MTWSHVREALADLRSLLESGQAWSYPTGRTQYRLTRVFVSQSRVPRVYETNHAVRRYDCNKQVRSPRKRTKSLLCVGLTRLQPIPERIQIRTTRNAFNRWIIEQTHERGRLQTQPGFTGRGEQAADLAPTMEYLRDHHPDIFTIADAKRADIVPTWGTLCMINGFYAVTLHPYFAGGLALLARLDKAATL